MNAPARTGAESFSRGVWPGPTRRAVRLRPGWLTAMVAKAQEQLHRGLVPMEPRAPCQRRKPVTTAPASPLPMRTTPSVPPTLQHIEREDLTDIQRVLVLYQQAV